MIKRHKLCFSAANLILSECLFMTGMYLRRSILPLRWIVFSSHTATLLLQTLQHNNYLKYLTKFSLWFFLPRNIHKYVRIWNFVLHSNDRKKNCLEETSKSKLEIFFYIHFRFILIIMRHFESHLKLKSKIRQLILAGVHCWAMSTILFQLKVLI